MAVVVDILLAGVRDTSGNPLAGGLVYTYAAGTSTPKATYTDLGNPPTAEANPIVLDSNGMKQVYAEGSYKFVIKTSAGATLYTFDNISFLAASDTIELISDSYADVKSVTTAETTLATTTLRANLLANNGEKLEVVYGGVFVYHATATRRLRIYFGATSVFDSGAVAVASGGAWIIFMHIIRVSATVLRFVIRVDTQTTTAISEPSYISEITGQDLTVANILKITGTAAGAGAASDDIWVRTAKIKWLAAA